MKARGRTAEQVAAFYRQEIESGRLPAGHMLPRIVDMAAEHGSGLSVVQSAMRALQVEGLVARRPVPASERAGGTRLFVQAPPVCRLWWAHAAHGDCAGFVWCQRVLPHVAHGLCPGVMPIWPCPSVSTGVHGPHAVDNRFFCPGADEPPLHWRAHLYEPAGRVRSV